MSDPVVHLELHTGNLPRACAFYTQLFGWRAGRVAGGEGSSLPLRVWGGREVGESSYLALGLGQELEGGVVESDTERSLWLPYVEVEDIAHATERARELGATVALEP